MEYIEGAPVSGPLDAPEATRVALQMATALEAAHGKGIIHCDLKPANVLISGGRVKLLGPRVGREIFMYSITLEPEHDTPAVLKAYARAHGVEAGWTFLTGRPGDIERLRRSLGFTDPDPIVDKDKANHIGNIRYGNEPMMLWAACPGLADARWIVESISWVVRPKPEGRRTVPTA